MKKTKFSRSEGIAVLFLANVVRGRSWGHRVGFLGMI